MRWIVWIVAAIAVIAVVVVVIGYSLPTAHTATRTLRLALPPEALYAVLSDVDRYPSWRPNVKSLVRAPDREGRPAWVEDTGGMKIPMYFERMDRPSLLVARIADPSLPFGGTWTYRITPAAGGSELTITEDGEVYNPIFRFMSRFVFGHHATLDEFIKHLQARA
jgi:uncharacterized protein YndB with AHSA1/START domain